MDSSAKSGVEGMSLISESIPPSAIDTSKHLWNAFDNTETEISALWIVRLCQERGSWIPFSVQDVEEVYHRKFPGKVFHLNRLTDGRADGPWIIKEGDMYTVSDDFIYRCYKASPAK